MAKFHEQVKRSVAKSITFRILVVISDTIVIYAITHRYSVTIAVVVLTNVASTVLYYVHERVWNAIHWGKSIKK